jgi:Suppressor of fused protein (SUFU)
MVVMQLFGRRQSASTPPMPPPIPPPPPIDDDEGAPGWDALDVALTAHYGPDPAQHVGYVPPAAVSANLQGCSAYAAGDLWVYVTYGLSELYERRPEDDPEWSGWGFELTLRIPRGLEPGPPGWPFTMLNEVAKHINTKAVLLEPGHRFEFASPVTGYPHTPDGPDTGLTVFAFTVDPELGEVETLNGKVRFLAAVGVTAAEKQQMLDTSTADVLARLAAVNPLLVTDPARARP